MTRSFSKRIVAITSIITLNNFDYITPEIRLNFGDFFMIFSEKINIYKNCTKTAKSVVKYYGNYIFLS